MFFKLCISVVMETAAFISATLPHVLQLSHKIEVINCFFRQVNYLVTLIFKTTSMSGSE